MKIIDVQQGSQAWLELRRTHDTASEASAALGVSKYTSRTTLLHQKSTGDTEQVGSAKQAAFNRGHESERAARPLAEEIIGESLYPITATLEVDGLKLLASLDGATMDEEIIWEHKLWSESLAADVRNETLAPHYTVQMDQQLLVSGAKKCLFMVSDGTADKMVWCWYATSPEKHAALISGWQQFRSDLAAYVPPEVIVPAVAAPQMGLPAVSIAVSGQIALVDNLDKFGAALTAYIAKLNRKPESDQDFANLEDAVKRLKAAEEQLDAAEASALGQTDSIDIMRRTVALHRETAKTTRLLIDKLVKAEKENRRTAIVGDAAAELVTHVRKLNDRLGKPYMPNIAADFQGVIKGLKSLDSMKDKVAGELARCKIEANAVAGRIQANLETKGLHGYAFLFADLAAICTKAPEDFQNTVTARITAHEAAQAAKEEATRERIRAEEQAKAQREAAELAEKEAQRIKNEAYLAGAEDRERARQAEMAGAVLTMRQQQEVIPPGPAAAAITHEAVVAIMPATVRQAMAPKPATPPSLRIGEIANRLGFGITESFLRHMDFVPAGKQGASVLYHEADFPAICQALIDHIAEVSEQFDSVAA